MFAIVNVSLLPSANEVCEGYVFTRVCNSVHGGMSRPRPGGCPGPDPGGCPGPGLGVCLPRGMSRPRPGEGVSRPRPNGGVYPSMHWGRHSPSRRLLLRTVHILLECILVVSCCLSKGWVGWAVDMLGCGCYRVDAGGVRTEGEG